MALPPQPFRPGAPRVKATPIIVMASETTRLQILGIDPGRLIALTLRAIRLGGGYNSGKYLAAFQLADQRQVAAR